MKVWTIWEEGRNGDMPWLVVAVDEYTIEEHGGMPAFYTKELTEGRRELILNVRYEDIEKLFKVRTVPVTAEVP
jgi:hypothetical protein